MEKLIIKQNINYQQNIFLIAFKNSHSKQLPLFLAQTHINN